MTGRTQYAPCSLCGQYSHSIGEDQIAEAFMHFQSMYGHPVRGHPMGHNFDERTRDAVQVLTAAIRAAQGTETGTAGTEGSGPEDDGPVPGTGMRPTTSSPTNNTGKTA